jgi:hypothetical protein
MSGDDQAEALHLAVRAAIGKAPRAGLKDIAAFFLHDPAVRAAASTANGGRVDVRAICLVFAFQVSVGKTWDDLVRKNQDMKIEPLIPNCPRLPTAPPAPVTGVMMRPLDPSPRLGAVAPRRGRRARQQVSIPRPS